MRGISRLTEELLASQEGLCCMVFMCKNGFHNGTVKKRRRKFVNFRLVCIAYGGQKIETDLLTYSMEQSPS